MPYLIGIVLALGVALFARVAGFDRDRAFYPTVLIVIGFLYDLFGVMGGSTHALVAETCVGAGFFLLAWLGFKYSAWLVAAGLVAHGVFDWFHAHLITNAGVPVWWPQFCMTYDVTAGFVLAWLLWREKRTASG